MNSREKQWEAPTFKAQIRFSSGKKKPFINSTRGST